MENQTENFIQHQVEKCEFCAGSGKVLCNEGELHTKPCICTDVFNKDYPTIEDEAEKLADVEGDLEDSNSHAVEGQ